MNLWISLAWRNIFRNKRRSYLAGLAIGIGLASLIFADAMIIGMKNNMIKSATSSYLGHGQVHAKGFRETLTIENTIKDDQKIVDHLKKQPEIAAVTTRTQVFGMINSPANSDSTMVIGIDADTEKQISKISQAMKQGDYNSVKDGKILIGSDLADILSIGLDDKIVLTVAQAETGEISQHMFRVGGIFQFGIREMDRFMTFIDIKESQKILMLPHKVHEIAFTFKKLAVSRDKTLSLWCGYDQNTEIMNWEQLMPELSSMLEMSQFMVWILALILFGIVAIGVINTLFMSLYERMFEFGVLKAVGTRPKQLRLLIILEAGILALISIVIGTVVGTIAVIATNHFELLDYRGAEYMNVAITEMIYPVLHWSQYVKYPLVLLIFTLIVGIYPAIYASKITPAKAMKKGL